MVKAIGRAYRWRGMLEHGVYASITGACHSREDQRKTSLILLGAAAGVAVMLIATKPRIVFDGARPGGGRRHVSAAQPVWRRVRAGAPTMWRSPTTASSSSRRSSACDNSDHPVGTRC